MIQLNDIIAHARDHTYMSGVDRNRQRIKATGEVFTPTELVREILDKLDKMDQDLFKDPTKKFLDPSCGDGQFLSEVLIRKINEVSTNGEIDNDAYATALDTIYGVDIMKDNCIETIKRLYMGITEEDIICIPKEKITEYYWQSPGIEYIFKLTSNPDKILNIVCADALQYDFSFGHPPEPEELEPGKPAPVKKIKQPKAKKPADNNRNDLFEGELD
jgi:hypothetical protein